MQELEFEKVFRQYFKVLANIAFTIVRDEDTAKDIVQQVFLNLWQKREKLKIKSQLKSYLHRAVINTSLNYNEKNKNLRLLNENEKSEAFLYESEKQELSSQALEKGVHKAIDELPEKCKLVFTLSRFSGMKNREIAEYLEISIKSVEKHIGKALKQLKVSLKTLYDSSLLAYLVFFYLAEVGFFYSKLSFC